MFMNVVCIYIPAQMPRERIAAKASGSCKPPDLGAGSPTLLSLEEKQELLISKPSLQNSDCVVVLPFVSRNSSIFDYHIW